MSNINLYFYINFLIGNFWLYLLRAINPILNYFLYIYNYNCKNINLLYIFI